MNSTDFMYDEDEIQKIENRNKSKKSYENLAFLHSPWARTIRMLSEYQYPLSIFDSEEVSGTVVFFGSARAKSSKALESLSQVSANAVTLSKYYEDARELARRLTLWFSGLEDRNLLICSGGGPGIMEAANHGAHDAGGESIGLNISLPFEQKANPYVPKKFNMEFHYFFLRKYWFISMAEAIIIFPGGFGTLDEMLETLTLMQTKKLEKIPLIVYGPDFWKKILNFDALIEYGVISAEDMDLIYFCDNVDEAFEYLKKHITSREPGAAQRRHTLNPRIKI